MSLHDLAILAVAVVLGVAGAGMAWTRLGEVVRVATASSPSTDATAGAVVRVEGVVGAAAEAGEAAAASGGETVTAPVSGRECVGYVVSQEQRYATRVPIPRWRSVHAEGTVGAFALDTPDGRTRVVPSASRSSDEPATLLELGGDPPGSLFSDLSLPRRTTTDRLDVEASPPAAVEDACQRGLPAPSHPHRYREWRVEPGDELAVVGTLEDPSPQAADAVVSNDDDGTFVLSATSRSRTVLVYAARTAAYALFATGALAVAGTKLSAIG